MSRSRLSRCAAFAVLLVWAAPSLAEPTSEAIRMARKRFQEGVAAVDVGNFEAARVAFQQAFALKPHPTVLRNLGQAELKTAHYLEAARHLSAFLRDTTFGTATERESARKALVQAESKVGKLAIDVDIDGAEITVDGEIAGRSPMGADPYYVEPGQRLVRVQRQGYQPYEQSQMLEPARTTQLRIVLRPDAVATPAASESPIQLPDAASPSPLPDESGAGLGAPPPGPALEGSSPGSGRLVLLAVTAGVAVVSAGVSVGFALHANSLDDDADKLKAQLGQTYAEPPCPRAGSACDDLHDLNQGRAHANEAAWILAGVATVAGAVDIILLLSGKPQHTAGAFPTLSPLIAADNKGIGVVGEF